MRATRGQVRAEEEPSGAVADPVNPERTDGRREALTIALLAEPFAVAELRHTVRRHLTYWGLAMCTDTAQLCVSELVTNVIDHVGEGAPITLRVIPSVHGPRVELTDPDPRALPTLLSATDDQESGRGLALLDAFTNCWGVIQHTDSKTIWCELATSRP